MDDRSSGQHGDRLDKWLWCVRLYKTRSLAADACRRGQVHIGGCRARPSRQVAPGMEIELQQPTITRKVKVLATPGSRVGAKCVADYLEDLTPEEEREKASRIRLENRINRVFHVPGQGRPDKQQMRKIRQFLEARDEPPG